MTTAFLEGSPTHAQSSPHPHGAASGQQGSLFPVTFSALLLFYVNNVAA